MKGRWSEACLKPNIRDGPDKGGQHLESGGGVGVPAEPVLYLPAETVHDIFQRLVGEAHGVQTDFYSKWKKSYRWTLLFKSTNVSCILQSNQTALKKTVILPRRTQTVCVLHRCVRLSSKIMI